MNTLREHLEVIHRRHQQNTFCEGLPGEKFCAWCEKTWPCADYVDATMMLAILDDAETCQLPALSVAAARRRESIPAMRHRILRDPEVAS